MIGIGVAFGLGFSACRSRGTALAAAVSAISGRASWLRSDAGIVSSAGLISSWADRLGGTVTASQTTDANKPALVTSGGINGLPYLSCGIGDVFSNLNITGLGTYTSGEAFFVYRRTETVSSTNGYGGLYDIGSVGPSTPIHVPTINNSIYDGFGCDSRILVGTTSTAPLAAAYNTSHNGTSLSAWINGTQLASAVSCSLWVMAKSVLLGYTGTYQAQVFFKGEFYEFLMFGKALTAAERTTVRDYLAHRYNIQF